MEFKNNYPCVFIHGLMGYGEQDFMDVVFPNFGLFNHTFFKHLKERGIETYNPSLGPMNSAWDRACILWAYLFGGRVDYGKAHSEKYGHARYGKEYPGVLKDLGQTEAHKKMNLIGHSFGGPTVKTVAWLFAFGSEEERADTPAEELSPLFAGGHGNLLHTVTTLSGVNNGTALASFFGNKGMSVANYAYMALATFVGDTYFTRFIDYATSQWGNMPFSEDVRVIHFRNPLKYLDASRAFDRNKTFDNINHEMQIEVVQEVVNPSLQYPENVYFFAQRADGTKPSRNGNPVPSKSDMILPCWLVGQLTGRAMLKRLEKYGVRTDPNWRRNDGLVNLVGQSAPLNATYEEADYDTDFKPGIWYNMPPERGDHALWVGWLVPAKRLNAIYDRMIDFTALFRTRKTCNIRKRPGSLKRVFSYGINAQVSLDGVRVVLYNGLWKPWSAGEERQTANRRKTMSKTLVTYFSASGVTANKGQKIAQKTGADTFEIKPAVPYTSADLNWQNKQSRSSIECNDPACRPEIVDGTVDLSAYDTVYIGYPIWWYTAPNIINTFIEANLDGLKGKRIVLFKTSGGSGISKSVSDLQGKYPNLSFEAE